MRFLNNLWIAFDQLVSALGGLDPDETVSSYAGRNVGVVWWCKGLCRMLHPLDRNHCKDAIEKQPEGGNAAIDGKYSPALWLVEVLLIGWWIL